MVGIQAEEAVGAFSRQLRDTDTQGRAMPNERGAGEGSDRAEFRDQSEGVGWNRLRHAWSEQGTGQREK